MPRFLVRLALLGFVISQLGCASTWDTITSRRFREKPFGTMFGSDDPLTVLRNNPDGDARARAMLKLKEPAKNGQGEEVQEEVLQILHAAATTDSSPWIRIAAIEKLGEFEDPRAVTSLVQAFHTAHGMTIMPPDPVPTSSASGIEPAGLNRPARLPERFGLQGPQGFTSDQVMSIRGRCLEALGKTNHPEALTLLVDVARGKGQLQNEDALSRDFVRQRAVASLGKLRHKESVQALSEVLASEHAKDQTLTNLAHAGLVSLTGQKLPANPETWTDLVQAGNYTIAPEPNAIQRAIGFGTP